MTTINNLTIEQMREIVGGAPDWATGYAVMQNAYTLYNFYCADLKLDDLRTAIAEHEINEIEMLEASDTSMGDFEEFMEHEFEQFLTNNDMPIRKGKDGYLFSNRLVYNEWVKSPELGLKCIQELKSTTVKLPEPIKQIESDHVTDIRNHLSPSTVVVDL